MPLAYWLNKMDFDDVDNGMLFKALEVTGVYNTEVQDSTHGHLRIEITKKKLPALKQVKWFLCCSTPNHPNLYVGNYDKVLYGKVLQASWDRWINDDNNDEDEALATEQEQQPAQPTPSPHQPTESTMAQSVASPQLTDADDDLLTFFQSIINPSYLSKDDLFCVPSANLRSKVISFSKQMEADNHATRLRFMSDAIPEKCAVKDISEVPPCPLLHAKYGIPWSVPALSEVATAIVNLGEHVPEVLQLPKFGGSKGRGKTLVPIVPSSDKKRLHYNAKQWMALVIQAATSDNDEVRALDTYDIVSVLLRVVHTFDSLAFENLAAAFAARNEESCISKLKMDAELQQAVMYKANINKSQMRTIKSFLCATNLDVFQPETEMRKLEVNDFIKPTPIPFKDGGNRTKTAWSIPVDEMLQYNTNKALEAGSFQHDLLTRAHVVLVGDHGQGAFRMMATLLLITRDGRRSERRHADKNYYEGTELALEVDGQCGYIQCQKDTYKVLEETISVPIDEPLWRIRNNKVLSIYSDTIGGIPKMCWGKPTVDKHVLAEAEVELFMTGDLAFYSIALGKEY